MPTTVQRPTLSLIAPAGYDTAAYTTLYSAYAATTAHADSPTFAARRSRNVSDEFAIANTIRIASTFQYAAGSFSLPATSGSCVRSIGAASLTRNVSATAAT